MSEMVSRALNGRQERKKWLAYIVDHGGGLDYSEIKGKFTLRYAVSHRTFSEYLSDLQDEGVIYQEEDKATGRQLWWTANGRAKEEKKN